MEGPPGLQPNAPKHLTVPSALRPHVYEYPAITVAFAHEASVANRLARSQIQSAIGNVELGLTMTGAGCWVSGTTGCLASHSAASCNDQKRPSGPRRRHVQPAATPLVTPAESLPDFKPC